MSTPVVIIAAALFGLIALGLIADRRICRRGEVLDLVAEIEPPAWVQRRRRRVIVPGHPLAAKGRVPR